MPRDVDIVRCASPWPGPAAQILDALADLGSGSWTPEALSAAAGTGLGPGEVNQVLSGLRVTGACDRSEDGESWTTAIEADELRRLATLLRGADHFRRLRVDSPALELVVTLPLSPSSLEQHLASAPGHPGGFLPTADAFLRIAAAATSRLIVVSPFIDQAGFRWLRQVFEAASPLVQKVAVLRNTEQYTVELGVHHSEWLRALGVSVRDYHLSHDGGMHRALPIETFHSKLVLADDRLAYVGSANILGSGSGRSLEAGVLVDGRAARQVANLVDGILRIARTL